MKKGFARVEEKIVSVEALAKLVLQWKNAGDKIVFTNGCFDLVHLGHIHYLADAAALGNRLIIGLNSDHSVACLKGENRPLNPESGRAALLASFFFVDAVVLFSEETPLKLITTLLPDILVKGGDYTVEQIAGAKEVLADGGKVELLTFLPGYSSTAIIKKIQNSRS